MKIITISVQTEDFEVGVEFQKLRNEADNAGAIVNFIGLVREFYEVGSDDNVQELFLEHYPGMTEKCLNDIASDALNRWPISCCHIIHRVGALFPGDQIVFVGTASPHREAAFKAAEFVMDYLKTKAPFWKRQTDGNGRKWVEFRSSDVDAANRWRR